MRNIPVEESLASKFVTTLLDSYGTEDCVFENHPIFAENLNIKYVEYFGEDHPKYVEFHPLNCRNYIINAQTILELDNSLSKKERKKLEEEIATINEMRNEKIREGIKKLMK